MWRPISRPTGVLLIVAATVLAAFNGFLSRLSVLVFSDHESDRMWASIYLPMVLWIAALASLKFPRSALVAYVALLLGSIILCVDPLHHLGAFSGGWMQCADNLRFAIAGEVLLGVNFAFAERRETPD